MTHKDGDSVHAQYAAAGARVCVRLALQRFVFILQRYKDPSAVLRTKGFI